MASQKRLGRAPGLRLLNILCQGYLSSGRPGSWSMAEASALGGEHRARRHGSLMGIQSPLRTLTAFTAAWLAIAGMVVLEW
jgi:hypothetical protein